MSITVVLIILAMLLLNGLFAAYELALASVRTERLRLLAEDRKPGAKSALRMKNRMEASLAVVQVGITLVGAIAAATGGASAEQTLHPWIRETLGVGEGFAKFLALALVVAPLAAVTIVVGELIPKVFAIKNNELVCRALSPAMLVFSFTVFPAVWAFEGVTKLAMLLLDRLLPAALVGETQTGLHELRAQVNLLRASQVIGMQEERIILQASRLTERKVREIMLPADDIVMLRQDAPLTENLAAAHLDLHTRFPVTTQKGDPQGIVGYVTFKEMVMLAKTHPGNPVLNEITRPLVSLPEDLAISEAMRRMIADSLHLALVRDGQGRVIGLLTQEDIFEELVGEIEDEFDRLPRHIIPSGRNWIVGGGASLGQLRAALARPELGPDLPSSACVHDWLKRSHPADFHGGDALEIDGLRALVRKVRRRRVAEALLEEPKRPMPG